MTPMTKMNCQAVFVSFLPVATTEDVVFFGLTPSFAEVTDTFSVML
jgi:hypothetical protein